jgi:hypothetical protein
VSVPGIAGIGDLLALDEQSRAVSAALAAKLNT